MFYKESVTSYLIERIMVKNLILLAVLGVSAACAPLSSVIPTHKEPDTLTVLSDGTMVFNNRTINENDVVIYPDGTGGERAAIRIFVPFKTDFYRDSIRVHREDAEIAVVPN